MLIHLVKLTTSGFSGCSPFLKSPEKIQECWLEMENQFVRECGLERLFDPADATGTLIPVRTAVVSTVRWAVENGTLCRKIVHEETHADAERVDLQQLSQVLTGEVARLGTDWSQYGSESAYQEHRAAMSADTLSRMLTLYCKDTDKGDDLLLVVHMRKREY
jgi:hypothetical protein